MDMLNIAKEWILARWAERTSWDGAIIIGVSVCVLVAAPIICLLYTSPSPRDS